jgi:hypothetical protein
MRRVFLLGCLVVFWFCHAVSASPIEVVFSGQVTRIDGNYTPDIEVGDAVSFTYLIDFDADGMETGAIKADSQYYDYFYVEQTAGLWLLTPGTDTVFYGRRDFWNNQTAIRSGSYSYQYNDWWTGSESLPEGEYFYQGQYFYGNGGILYPDGRYAGQPYAFVRYDLWVQSINAVPGPASALLLAPSITGLIAFRKKRA